MAKEAKSNSSSPPVRTCIVHGAVGSVPDRSARAGLEVCDSPLGFSEQLLNNCKEFAVSWVFKFIVEIERISR